MNRFRTISLKHAYSIKSILVTAILWLTFSTVHAQNVIEASTSAEQNPSLTGSGFIYTDIDTLRNRLLVVIEQGLWQYHLEDKRWKFLTALEELSDGLDEMEFGYDAKNDVLYFWDRGVGSFFRMDPESLSIEQLDQSHPHRNQFYHQPFIRNGTVYAFGGYGYWLWKNYITYYSKELKEWNVQNVDPSSNLPTNRIPNTGVYVSSFDTFYLFGGRLPKLDDRADDQFTEISDAQDIWKFSFEENSWEKVNQIDNEFRYYYKSSPLRFGKINKTSGSFYSEESKTWYIPMVQKQGQNDLVYLAPVDLPNARVLPHVLLDFSLSNELLPSNFLFDQQSKTAIIVGLKKTTNTQNYALDVVTIPEDSLLSDIRSSNMLADSGIYYLGGVLVIVFIFIFYLQKNSSKTGSHRLKLSAAISQPASIEWLKKEERELLSKLSHANYHLDSDQLDNVLWPDIDNYDYRRKLRNETINAINKKFKKRFDISLKVVTRVKDPNDKRRFLYGINEAIVNDSKT